MNALALFLLLTAVTHGSTSDEVISTYGLSDLAIDISQVSDSACPTVAESTYSWYNEENGLIDSQFSYISTDKPNCCRWIEYYDHQVFSNGVRATRVHKINGLTGDTVSRTMEEYSANGNLMVSDLIDLAFRTRTISAHRYDSQGRRIAYYHISVGKNGTRDTIRTEITTYGDGVCPEKLSLLGRNVYWYFMCTSFDSTEVAFAVRDGVESVHYIKFYDAEKRLRKWNQYSWHLEGVPLRKVTVFEYDKTGNILREVQFGPPDLLNRNTSPDQFVPTVIDYYTRDEQGRTIKFVRKQRAEDG